ncbi:MAG: hypothetical protein N3E37_03785, partial [Candidatus Micrarchaeota archaeon]|nr:hypothetical protein [Candidatus Micrarchaeota archaeon]
MSNVIKNPKNTNDGSKKPLLQNLRNSLNRTFKKTLPLAFTLALANVQPTNHEHHYYQSNQPKSSVTIATNS